MGYEKVSVFIDDVFLGLSPPADIVEISPNVEDFQSVGCVLSKGSKSTNHDLKRAFACCSKLLFTIFEVLWLAVQGLVVPIAISTLVVLFAVSLAKVVLKAKGDDAMRSKVKELMSMNLDVLYTMSANLAGGTLLAKALQMIIV